jgi:hypothetical protein
MLQGNIRDGIPSDEKNARYMRQYVLIQGAAPSNLHRKYWDRGRPARSERAARTGYKRSRGSVTSTQFRCLEQRERAHPKLTRSGRVAEDCGDRSPKTKAVTGYRTPKNTGCLSRCYTAHRLVNS